MVTIPPRPRDLHPAPARRQRWGNCLYFQIFITNIFLQLNIGSQLPLDPMVTNMAMNYGADIMKQKQQEVQGMMEKYVSVGQLKVSSQMCDEYFYLNLISVQYYFAVDNTYVTKKLALLMFPFAHSDWSIRYNHDEPVQPRFELNAADLYIPSMAFVSYILVVGYMLGLQDRFSPEILAKTSSSSLTLLVLELFVIYLTTTIMNINTTLAKCDIVAFCMYKYVGMILCLFMGMFFSTSGYYAALAYTALALAIFLFRTLHLRVEPEVGLSYQETALKLAVKISVKINF